MLKPPEEEKALKEQETELPYCSRMVECVC